MLKSCGFKLVTVLKWLNERYIPITVLLLMFTIALGSSLSQNPHQQSRSNTSTYESTNTPQNSGLKAYVKTDNVPVEPEANPNPERNEWRSERGLLAQTEATRWAGWMLFVSVIMALLSAAGVAIVIWTLKETMKAGQKLSEQNAIALKASKAEFQPYLDAVLAEKPIVTVYERDDCFEVSVRGNIIITNTGKTPAIHMFGNIGFVIDAFISHGIAGKIGYSGSTESKSSYSSRLGRSMLGQGESYDYPISFSARFPKVLFDGANFLPSPDKIRVGLGLRMSFTDDFVSSKKMLGRYGRRVMEYEFGPDVARSEVMPAPFLREVGPKKLDYPEEHNDLEPFLPHVYYSSGALGAIKMPDFKPFK